jgi:excisionase family DNA binding protein
MQEKTCMNLPTHNATPQPKANKLLRAPEVREVLGICQSQAYRLMQNGTLPTVRIGRSLRVPADALQKWIENNTKPGAGLV